MRTLKYFTCIILLTFQSISAQDFWQQTNGPYHGATVNDFLLFRDSIIFIATNEGLIKSSDNGENWIRINGQYLNAKITCTAKDKFDVMYAGRYDNIDGIKLLFRSTDHGNNWSYINYGYDALINFILIPYRDTILIGSSDMGIIRTFDRGVNWSRVNNGIDNINIYEIIKLSDGSLLAGSAGGGVYKSTNWGDSWTASNSGLPSNTQGNRYAESFFEITNGCVLTGTRFGIYYSTNYGDSWSFKSNGLGGKVAKCIVEDDNILYAGIDGNNGVYYSTNSGDYWYQLGLGYGINTIGWDSDSRLFAGGLNYGMYRFIVEDSTWIPVYNQSYTPVEVNDLCLTTSGNLLASTRWWGIHYTTNNGELWTRLNYTDNEPNAIETINDSIFLGGGDFHVFASNDYGNTWSITGDFWVGSIYYEPNSEILYLGTGDAWTDITGLYTSIDFGQTWTLLYSFPQIVSEQMIIALRVTKTKKVILASVMYHFPPPTWEDFYRFYQSTDTGQTWETILEDDSRYVSDLIEDVSSNLYAFAGDALLISEDEGQTWIIRNIPPSAFLASDYSGRIFRANGDNVWYSSDKGISWIIVDNSGLQGSINDIVINHNNKIYLATEEGVFIGEADSIVVSVENDNPLKTFNLSQNYPNPFNPVTKIEFRIADFGFVSLKVYDILGNEIVTLVNEEKQPGTYEVEFNTSSIKHLPSSGIYFYQLKSGDYTETKKMVLMK